jgi:hypothetical protein
VVNAPDMGKEIAAETTGTGDQMSRTFILIFAGVCWAGVAVDALVHLAVGDLVIPAAMGLAFAAWAMLFRRHYAGVPAQASMVPLEA